MKININVKRKFKINGKEYNYLEEMPDDVRNSFEKAMSSQPAATHGPVSQKTKITFNGREYNEIDEMPPDIRQLYEKVLKAAETGTATPAIDFSGINSEKLKGPVNDGAVNSYESRQPIKIESAFTLRTVISAVILGAIILVLYFLLHN